MSDVPRAPGWWQAADAKWYPPEPWTSGTARPMSWSQPTMASGGQPEPASWTCPHGHPNWPSTWFCNQCGESRPAVTAAWPAALPSDGRRRYRVLTILIFVTVLLLGVVIGVTVALIAKRSNGSNASSVTSTSSAFAPVGSARAGPSAMAAVDGSGPNRAGMA